MTDEELRNLKPPPGGSGVQPPPGGPAAWLEVVRSLAVEVEQGWRRLAAAAELAAQSFSRIAEAYERAHAELDDLPLVDCDECGIAHAASEVFKTPWDTMVCRGCWDQVTNGADLPEK
jgi:hypothetical protein